MAPFGLLRAAAERAGVFVLLLDDLGRHHLDVAKDIFRGFVTDDDAATFAVIHAADLSHAR